MFVCEGEEPVGGSGTERVCNSGIHVPKENRSIRFLSTGRRK